MAPRFRNALRLAAAAVVLAALALLLANWWFGHGPAYGRDAKRLVKVLDLRPGMTAADIGAGEGQVAIHLARRLAPGGRVFATELDPVRLEALRKAAAGVSNVTVLRAEEHSSALPEACCDVVYLRHVYHHLGDAAAINRSIGAALRPGGRLVIIDFLSPRWLPFVHHGIALDAVADQVKSAGFKLERRIEPWSPYDYCLVFRKAT
jgi:SAM-dependent methyltransferase